MKKIKVVSCLKLLKLEKRKCPYFFDFLLLGRDMATLTKKVKMFSIFKSGNSVLFFEENCHFLFFLGRIKLNSK